MNSNGHTYSNTNFDNLAIRNKPYTTTKSYRTSMSLIKNLQQITLAVYMVTDCVEDEEPLRIQARTAALNSMSCIAKVMGNVQSNSEQFRTAHANLILVKELIIVLEFMGYVSGMNASILTSEIDRFLSKLNESILDLDSPHNARVPMRSDMNMGIDLGVMFGGTEAIEKTPSVLPTSDFSKSPTGLTVQGAESEIATEVEAEASPLPRGKLDRGLEPAPTSQDHLRRQNTILKILRDTPTIGGVKELAFSDLLDKYQRYSGESGLGDKTIQRELSDLVDYGTIEKVGVKRWAKYRLVM